MKKRIEILSASILSYNQRLGLSVFPLLTFVLFANILFGQTDTVYLSKNFKFHDGVFMTFEDFKNNTPTYIWEDVEAGIHSNPQNFLAQMYYLRTKVEKDEAVEAKEIDLENIWGISLDGIPYVRLSKEALNKENTVFAGLKLRGKICYYEYEDFEMRKIPMSAYNPVTGKPFRTMNVERKFKVTHKNMLHFQTGETAVFSIENFKKWIVDDKKLLKTVEDLTPKEVDKKLFKCLLIYDDRNLVKVSK